MIIYENEGVLLIIRNVLYGCVSIVCLAYKKENKYCKNMQSKIQDD